MKKNKDMKMPKDRRVAEDRVGFINKDKVNEIFDFGTLQEHVARYHMIRQWCNGNVVDFASGCGYGSWMISMNPDVNHVYGFDKNLKAIQYAKENYPDKNVSFYQSDHLEFADKFKSLNIESIHTLVSLETIEHIEDTSTLPAMAEACKAENLIISFPSRKTTHYNPWHCHDFCTNDVVNLFPKYSMIQEIVVNEDQTTLRFMQKKEKN